ncbi:MAG TPA: histidine kinase [Nocardioidaceae bacterium]|nr:histidine kinase [Nocardioidaceae bacterium]
MATTLTRRIPPNLTTLGDVVLAVALAVAALVETVATGGERVGLRTALAVATALALLLRHKHPLVSTMLVATGLGVESLVAEPPDEIAILVTLLVSAFSVAAWAPLRESLLGLAFLSFALALAISRDPSDSVSNILPTLVLFVAVPGALGLAFSRRGRDLNELQRRAEELERRAEAAAQAERDRLARELHDVVSHAVTLIAVQAEAGQAVIDRDVEAARTALEAIGGASRDALAELAALLAVLREGDDSRRGLDDLDALLDGARSAGMRVQCERSGDTEGLPDEVDECAYRIVQESLTNALRHSREPQVSVCIARQGRELDVTVVSTGTRHRSRYGGSGRGLVGLRERVVALGGSWEAGPRERAFAVEATIPVAPQ